MLRGFNLCSSSGVRPQRCGYQQFILFFFRTALNYQIEAIAPESMQQFEVS
ncbi:hypothetical protein [Nostoc sp. WHI]|uniref:hypothetical protein n=1 Tax=Nostoc sp. WHI TaxID=2650611 RepID=UPI001E2FF1CE|nr:hypothetical protein [Nostoc sp. WHI]